MTRVVIVDYGLGNLFNVARAIEAVGARATISENPARIKGAERVLIPGVGAFGEGMRNLDRHGLADAIAAFASSGKSVLGICLGMQLLMEESHEFGTWPGLSLIPGRVTQLDPGMAAKAKVPQVGWNTIDVLRSQRAGKNDHTLMRGVRPGSFAYFVHSYAVRPAWEADEVATTTYGTDEFCSAIARDNVAGCQFHPEKSAQVGLTFLRNWLDAGT